MKYLIFLSLLISCAHKPVKNEENLVSVDTALKQAQASYLKGCVDAKKELKVDLAFPGCRDKAIIHRQELDAFMKESP